MKSNKISKRHIEHVTCMKTLTGGGAAYISTWVHARRELLTFQPEFTPGTSYISTWVHARNCLHFHLSSHQELLTFPPEFTPGILCGACSSIFCGLLCKSLFVLLFYLFICPSIYGFWLPLRYPLTCLSNTW